MVKAEKTKRTTVKKTQHLVVIEVAIGRAAPTERYFLHRGNT
jgi:hypothetical protein